MKKVVIGLSGGVDSSVAALILKRKGFDVHGVYMNNWDCNKKDYDDVVAVGKKLKIPVKKISFEVDYIDNVFIPFLKNLDKGFHINPDVLCNSLIKFGLLYDYAINKMGADFLATGHYCKNLNGSLYMSKDRTKDQSYFLYKILDNDLSRIIFPLQDFMKRDVRSIALRNGLITANKKDSTGICFIGNKKFKNFISRYRDDNPGDITFNGKVIGKHKGLHYYILGQRKGLDLSGGPFYVVNKNLSKNTLIVGKKDLLMFKKASFFDKVGDFRGDCFARFSNLGDLYKVNISNNSLTLKDSRPKVGLGQSVVFYSIDGKVLGGALISKYE